MLVPNRLLARGPRETGQGSEWRLWGSLKVCVVTCGRSLFHDMEPVVSTCPKTPYFTLHAAGRALLAVRARMRAQKRDRVVVGVHRCGLCSAFHLTSARSAETSRWTKLALAKAGE
ncbi:MAG: hypothetical protein JWP75_3427 [Frondihabitans sp.]|nr:hypothetical protein [Frondihabitans sp.]